jgi:curli biogenesis system outer membrane secretion channel CsgG
MKQTMGGYVMHTFRVVVALILGTALVVGLAGVGQAQLIKPKATVTTPEGKSIEEAQQEAYDGPKARVAVARFTDKSGKGWWTGAIGDGMADMMTTALFHTNRYIVLERQTVNDVLREQDLGGSGRIKKGTEAPIGEIEGAELLITGAVTEFEGAQSGVGGGLGGIGGTAGRILGGIAGGIKNAHMAIDVRVIDTKTSRIVAATSVEGQATDFALGGALAGDREGAANLHPGGREVHRHQDAGDVLPVQAGRWDRDHRGGARGRRDGGHEPQRRRVDGSLGAPVGRHGDAVGAQGPEEHPDRS